MTDHLRTRRDCTWPVARIDAVGSVQLGRQRSPSNRSSAYPTPYIRAANITESGLDLGDVNEMEFRPSERRIYELRPGDIVLSEASGSPNQVGKPALWRGDIPRCCYQNTVIRFRPVEINGAFALWLFRHFYMAGIFARSATGVGINHLGAQRFGALMVPVPPDREQVSIAEELDRQFSRLDAGVEALQRAQANLKRYRAAVLKAACEGKLVPTEAELARREGRTYETGARLLERILAERRAKWQGRGKYKEPAAPDNANLPVLPEGWVWATVERVCARFVDSAHRTPKYGADGLPALGPRDVVGGTLRLDQARLTSEEEFATQTRRCVPEAGDLVYSRELSLGWAAKIPDGARVCLSQGMCFFRAVSQMSTAYLLFVLNGPVGRRQAERAAVGSAHPHLNLGDIQAMRVPLPPLAEQERIVAEVERRLSVAEGVEAAVAANLRRAGRLRQAVLAKAFGDRIEQA